MEVLINVGDAATGAVGTAVLIDEVSGASVCVWIRART